MGIKNNYTKLVIVGISITFALALIFSPSIADALHVTSHKKSPGAIFTTVPDGTIVNENVRYTEKIQVYLDGGPPPHAPQTAAGLADGWWVFQITDPSGKVLLSQDPSKCRVVEVEDGIIKKQIMAYDLTLDGVDGGADLDLTEDYSIKDGKGGGDPAVCHIADDPPHPTPIPDQVAGISARHDNNTDTDHGPDGAIVVQMMPFLDTTNPGGVYKAWMTPYPVYLDEGTVCDGLKGRELRICTDLSADPEAAAQQLLDDMQVVKVKGNVIGFKPDPGFGPSNHESKTDNFKVVEERPPVPPEEAPEIHILKFHDVNANGLIDDEEPEIGVNQCVDDTTGALEDPCDMEGGWPIILNFPVGDPVPGFTPFWEELGVAGSYLAVEAEFDNWTPSCAFLTQDGGTTSFGAVTEVPIEIELSVDPDNVTVEFCNYMPVDISGKKVIDDEADGLITGDTCPENDPGCAFVDINLAGTDGMGGAVDITIQTDSLGNYEFTNIKPGSYTITIGTEPAGFVCSFPLENAQDTTCDYVINPASGEDSTGNDFGDFAPVDISGKKVIDDEADGLITGDTCPENDPGCAFVDINLAGTDGMGGAVDITIQTDSLGNYEFTNIKPGSYTITIGTEPAGFVCSFPLENAQDTTCDYVINPASGEDSTGNDFGDFAPVDISGKKVIDDEADGLITGDTCPENDPGCAFVDINLAGTDGMGGAVDITIQTDSLGNYEFTNIKPGSYTITIGTEPAGFVCSFPLENAQDTTCDYVINPASGEDSTGNDFGDFAPVDIHAFKFFDVSEDGMHQEGEAPLEGILICLEDSDMNPVTEDLDGTPFPVVVGFPGCQFTNGDGLVWWTNLAPGEYTAFEDLDNSMIQGLFPVNDVTQMVTLTSGETHTFEFANIGFCEGLTPGFWKNWSNHFTEQEMQDIIDAGDTIVNTVAEVDAIFDDYNASDPQAVENNILAVFILANQLTLNLTQLNPDNQFGTLFNACMIDGEAENLGFHLDMAVDMWEDIMDGNPPPAQDILDKKNILDAFANS